MRKLRPMSELEDGACTALGKKGPSGPVMTKRMIVLQTLSGLLDEAIYDARKKKSFMLKFYRQAQDWVEQQRQRKFGKIT